MVAPYGADLDSPSRAWLLALARPRAARARPRRRAALQPLRPRRACSVAASASASGPAFASPHRRERRAWLLIGAGVAAWTFGEIYYTAVLWTADEIPIPSPADVGYLLFPPFMLVGVLALLRSRTRDVPGTLWADGITAALAVSAASAALVFETVLDSASGQALEVAVSLAYPLTDLVLLGVIVGALAGTGWQLDRTWVLLVRRRRHLLARRLALPRRQRERHLRAPAPGSTIGWWLGLLLIGAAAWQPVRPALGAARSTSGCGGSSLPLAFGVGRPRPARLRLPRGPQRRSPSALAAASLLAVMARTMLTFRDNVGDAARLARGGARPTRSPASATGARSRARSSASCRARPTERPARARALRPRRLQALQRHLRPPGRATRCWSGSAASLAALPATAAAPPSAWAATSSARCFSPGADAAEPLIVGAAAALSEHGEGFEIGCSYGAIELPRRGARRRRGAADRRPAHVRAEERRPHVGQPPEQGRAAARAGRAQPRAAQPPRRRRRPRRGDRPRLELSHDEVEQVRHAAELHDVGKVADPGRDPHQAGPARRRRVGVHPPPHDHRRADHRRRAGAHARRRARPLQPRALGRRRLPRRAAGRRTSRSAPGSSPSPTRSTR